MPKQEVPVSALQQYVPAGSAELVLRYLHQYKVHLTISRERQSVLGDYRIPSGYQNHRISVNGNLNPFAFLITLVHELAHLLAFEQYGRRIKAHGTEWQNVYAAMLAEVLALSVFPEDITQELLHSMRSPAASTCAETRLTRVLARYDKNDDGLIFVEQLQTGQRFATKDGRVFQRGDKRRTRFFGTELATGKIYLFSGLYRVKAVG
jgi:SprT protein